jgi:hypothetical protein
LLQLREALKLRLIPPLDKVFHAILDGQNNRAAIWVLVQTASNIIFAMLEALPPTERTEYIQSIRSELEVCRKAPGGMSMTTYLEGSFQLGSPPMRIH